MTTGWVNSMEWTEWTEAEEAEVVKGFMRHGRSWRRIRAEFNFHRSRTEKDIMYTWRHLCRRKGFLAQHASALIAMLVGADNDLRESAASELGWLDPATMAQRVDVQVAWRFAARGYKFSENLGLAGWLDIATLGQHTDGLLALLKLFDDDAERETPLYGTYLPLAYCARARKYALQTLGLLEPATLAQHADAVVAMLEDPDEGVRCKALDTMRQLDPATLAQHVDAVVNMLDDPGDYSCRTALKTLGKLDPATLAQHADAVVAKLKDDDCHVRRVALETLGKLDQATLTQHADAVVAMLKDTTDVGRVQVRGAALAPLRALPHYIIRGIDFDDLRKRALAAKNARELFRDSREFEVLHSQLLGRLRWYRCRIRWRVQRLVLYWYALPYRPSGPEHARDVEAWDRMNETRGQTPRLQPPEQSGAEADESTSSESLAASTWTCHRCRYQNYGAIRCALCGSPRKQPAAGPHETTRARKRRHANMQAWSPEEDGIIVDMVRIYGPKWSKIVQMLPGRTVSSVRNRSQRIEKLPTYWDFESPCIIYDG